MPKWVLQYKTCGCLCHLSITPLLVPRDTIAHHTECQFSSRPPNVKCYYASISYSMARVLCKIRYVMVWLLNHTFRYATVRRTIWWVHCHNVLLYSHSIAFLSTFQDIPCIVNEKDYECIISVHVCYCPGLNMRALFQRIKLSAHLQHFLQVADIVLFLKWW